MAVVQVFFCKAQVGGHFVDEGNVAEIHKHVVACVNLRGRAGVYEAARKPSAALDAYYVGGIVGVHGQIPEKLADNGRFFSDIKNGLAVEEGVFPRIVGHAGARRELFGGLFRGVVEKPSGVKHVKHSRNKYDKADRGEAEKVESLKSLLHERAVHYHVWGSRHERHHAAYKPGEAQGHHQL